MIQPRNTDTNARDQRMLYVPFSMSLTLVFPSPRNVRGTIDTANQGRTAVLGAKKESVRFVVLRDDF